MSVRDDILETAVSEEGRLAGERPPAELIAQLVREGKFCAAARLYSESTGHDLLESKLAIDRLAHRHGLAPINGCASHFLLLIALISAGLWGVVELLDLS